MHKFLRAFWPGILALGTFGAKAQDKPEIVEMPGKTRAETQEIIIRKKGDKDATLHLEISGDKITINGKPLMEYDDSTITVYKRKMVVGRQLYDERRLELEKKLGQMQNRVEVFGMPGKLAKGEKRAMLGVLTDKAEGGVVIESFAENSAAEAAGLKKGDIITAIDDTKISDATSLTAKIRSYKPGDEVTVGYKRDGKNKTAKAVLKESTTVSETRTYTFSFPNDGQSFYMPDMSDITPKALPPMPEMPGSAWAPYNSNSQRLGIRIQDTEDETGVKVLNVAEGLTAEKAGVQKDDIITEINGKKIATTDDARDEMKKAESLKAYSVKVKRNGKILNLEVKPVKKIKTVNL